MVILIAIRKIARQTRNLDGRLRLTCLNVLKSETIESSHKRKRAMRIRDSEYLLKVLVNPYRRGVMVFPCVTLRVKDKNLRRLVGATIMDSKYSLAYRLNKVCSRPAYATTSITS